MIKRFAAINIGELDVERIKEEYEKGIAESIDTYLESK